MSFDSRTVDLAGSLSTRARYTAFMTRSSYARGLRRVRKRVVSAEHVATTIHYTAPVRKRGRRSPTTNQIHEFVEFARSRPSAVVDARKNDDPSKQRSHCTVYSEFSRRSRYRFRRSSQTYADLHIERTRYTHIRALGFRRVVANILQG